MQSKGFAFPTGQLLPEQSAQAKAVETELEQHMKDWVAKEKGN